MSLENSLATIPGLAGYLGMQDRTNRQTMDQVRMISGLQNMLAQQEQNGIRRQQLQIAQQEYAQKLQQRQRMEALAASLPEGERALFLANPQAFGNVLADRMKTQKPQVVGNRLVSADGKVVYDGGPSKTGQTELQKLQSYLEQMPENDPRRNAVEARIAKLVAPSKAPSTTVIMGPQESEFQKALGKDSAKSYNDLQQADVAAGYKIARLDRMGQLLEGVKTGRLTPTTKAIAEYADALGIKIDPSVPAMQAVEQLSNEMALQLRNPAGGAGMPGALSDRDREFLVAMTPGLAKTPEGNKLIIETSRKLAQREKDVAKLARDYRKKNGRFDEGFYEELSQFSAQNPLFGAAVTLPDGRVVTFPNSVAAETFRKKLEAVK